MHLIQLPPVALLLLWASAGGLTLPKGSESLSSVGGVKGQRGSAPSVTGRRGANYLHVWTWWGSARVSQPLSDSARWRRAGDVCIQRAEKKGTASGVRKKTNAFVPKWIQKLRIVVRSDSKRGAAGQTIPSQRGFMSEPDRASMHKTDCPFH